MKAKIVKKNHIQKGRGSHDVLAFFCRLFNQCDFVTILHYIYSWTLLDHSSNYESFFEYMQQIPDWQNDIYKQRAAWSLMFAARVTGLENTVFIKNSRNCSFTLSKSIMYTTQQGVQNEQLLFIKVVDYIPLNQLNGYIDMSRGQDNIIIDNINGWIFNTFKMQNQELDGSFMNYVDSFLTYSGQDRWEFERLYNTSQSTSPFCLANCQQSSLTQRQMLISHAIDGESLMAMAERACLNNSTFNTSYNDVLASFTYFCEIMLSLGRDQGLIHNDLHLGNLFFDSKKKCITCIDYGRCNFQVFVDQQWDLLNKFADREVFKLYLDSGSDHQYYNTYETVVARYHKHLKSSYTVNQKYILHIVDYICLCSNMYFFILMSASQPQAQELQKLVKNIIYFKYSTKEDLLLRNVVFEIAENPNETIRAFKECKRVFEHIITNEEQKDSLLLILEGLCLLALLHNEKFVSDSGFTKTNTSFSLKGGKYVYHHFQYVGSEERLFDFAVNVIKQHRRDFDFYASGGYIEHVIQGIDQVMRGGKKMKLKINRKQNSRNVNLRNNWDIPSNIAQNFAEAQRAMEDWIRLGDKLQMSARGTQKHNYSVGRSKEIDVGFLDKKTRNVKQNMVFPIEAPTVSVSSGGKKQTPEKKDKNKKN